jgi:hypothetical protein
MGPADAVDQVVFRWSGNAAADSSGLRPVGYSCDPDLARAVFRDIGFAVPVEGPVRQSSLSRLRWEDRIVLLHRVVTPDPAGRPSTLCHALLGSERQLSPRVCLALHRWNWRGRGAVPLDQVTGRLPRLDREALRVHLEDGRAGIEARFASAYGPLTRAAAELLRAPERRLSVLDRSRGEESPLVLWGLTRLFEAQLGEWTFSTYETTDSGLCRVMFFPVWPESAAQDSSVTRIDAAAGAEVEDRGEADDIAAVLVDWYLTDPADYRQRVLGRLPHLPGTDIDERLDLFLDLLGTRRLRVPALPAARPQSARTGADSARAEPADGSPTLRGISGQNT